MKTKLYSLKTINDIYAKRNIIIGKLVSSYCYGHGEFRIGI